MFRTWFARRAVSRSLSASEVEGLLQRQPGFFQRLADAGDYLRNLFRSHRELTVPGVQKRVRELKKYRLLCYQKIDEHTAERGRIYRQLQAIRQRLRQEDCPPWQRPTLLLKAQEELFAYNHYTEIFAQWQKNLRMASQIIKYLEQLIGMMLKPMKEGELEQWAIEFQLAVEKEDQYFAQLMQMERRPQPATAAPQSQPARISAGPAPQPEPAQSQPPLRESALLEQLDQLLAQ